MSAHTDAETCPECGYYDDADPFARPWLCPECGAFFPELNFREGAE